MRPRAPGEGHERRRHGVGNSLDLVARYLRVVRTHLNEAGLDGVRVVVPLPQFKPVARRSLRFELSVVGSAGEIYLL